jgi:hypothetical protein
MPGHLTTTRSSRRLLQTHAELAASSSASADGWFLAGCLQTIDWDAVSRRPSSALMQESGKVQAEGDRYALSTARGSEGGGRQGRR